MRTLVVQETGPTELLELAAICARGRLNEKKLRMEVKKEDFMEAIFPVKLDDWQGVEEWELLDLLKIEEEEE